MLPRKYLKLPRNFADYEERFGWTRQQVIKLVGDHNAKLAGMFPGKAIEQLKNLAREYYNHFRENPTKIHLFPLTSTIFQYHFCQRCTGRHGTL